MFPSPKTQNLYLDIFHAGYRFPSLRRTSAPFLQLLRQHLCAELNFSASIPSRATEVALVQKMITTTEVAVTTLSISSASLTASSLRRTCAALLHFSSFSDSIPSQATEMALVQIITTEVAVTTRSLKTLACADSMSPHTQFIYLTLIYYCFQQLSDSVRLSQHCQPRTQACIATISPKPTQNQQSSHSHEFQKQTMSPVSAKAVGI